MKKIFSTLLTLILTLSIFAAPIVSIDNSSSSNKSDQEIKDLVAQSMGVVSLEDIQDVDYIFLAVTEDEWIIIEIDGNIYVIPPENE